MLYSRESALVLIEKGLDGLQSWSGCFGEEKNIFSLPGFEPSTVQPIA
jgi:hypothetical protein